MITISDDTIIITDHRQRAQVRFSALGGPEDPIEVAASDYSFAISREDIEQFQLAFVNFLNTGYFDQEG